jgi:hypothetical protein
MNEQEYTTGRRALTITLEDDPQQFFDEQCMKPEEQRVHSLLLDARNASGAEVRAWLDRCAAIPGLLEGSSAEWLIDEVTVIGNESMQHDEDIHLIQAEVHDHQRLMTSLSSTLTRDDDVEEFLNEQQRLPIEERSATIFFDARGISMESIERWIGFFYQYCDANTENLGKGAYEPATIIVISEYEVPEIFSGIDELRWIQTASEEEVL